MPENNEGISLVPQILTNRAEGFISTAKKLKALGYNEVNINLGCPSGTVVAKNKGAGFLAFPWELDRFLDEIYSGLDMEVSIKTRLGRDDPEEFYALMEIYNKYPAKELIIHPRIRQDFYKGHPRMDYFEYGLKESKNPVCYNGDLFLPEDMAAFAARFPQVESVMLGRGLLMNPALSDICAAGEGGSIALSMAYAQRPAGVPGPADVPGPAGMPGPADVPGPASVSGLADVRQSVIAFYNELYEAYKKHMSGERNVLFKMKELWFYLIQFFPGNEKNAKKIKKAQRLCDYEAAVRQIFLSAKTGERER